MAKNKITSIEEMPENVFDNQKEIIDLLKAILIRLDNIQTNTFKGY